MNTLYEKGMGVFLIRSQAPQISVKDCSSELRNNNCSPVILFSLYNCWICSYISRAIWLGICLALSILLNTCLCSPSSNNSILVLHAINAYVMHAHKQE